MPVQLNRSPSERSPLMPKEAARHTNQFSDMGVEVSESMDEEPASDKSKKGSHFHVFGVLLPVLMLVGGVFVLCQIEGWPMLTSLYVLTQIITTIGYGDFVVETSAAKLFMTFYVLCALVVLAYYLNIAITNVLDWQTRGIRRYLREIEDAADGTVVGHEAVGKKYGELNKLVAATILFVFMLGFGVVFFRFAEHCTCSYGLQKVPGCDDTRGFETCVATKGYEKDWIDALYMSTITLSTVGFGDLQPRSAMGRIVGIVWMLVGVAVAANFISALTEYFLDSEEGEKASHASLVKRISREQFDRIDRNDSGDFTRGEFLAYMLVTHMGVASDMVDGILNEFDKIDKTGSNKVTYDMLLKRQMEMDGIRDQKGARSTLARPSTAPTINVA